MIDDAALEMDQSRVAPDVVVQEGGRSISAKSVIVSELQMSCTCTY